MPARAPALPGRGPKKVSINDRRYYPGVLKPAWGRRRRLSVRAGSQIAFHAFEDIPDSVAIFGAFPPSARRMRRAGNSCPVRLVRPLENTLGGFPAAYEQGAPAIHEFVHSGLQILNNGAFEENCGLVSLVDRPLRNLPNPVDAFGPSGPSGVARAFFRPGAGVSVFLKRQPASVYNAQPRNARVARFNEFSDRSRYAANARHILANFCRDALPASPGQRETVSNFLAQLANRMYV